MNLRKIDAASDPALLQKIKRLYFSSFPKDERLPWFVLRLNGLRKGIDLHAFLDGDIFCGFTYSVTAFGLHFLLFFAVDETLRSQGYGSAILSMLRQEHETVILNIEPLDPQAPDLALRQSRYRFYRRNGFYDTGCHVLEADGIFRVLATQPSPDLAAYRKLLRYLTLGLWKEKLLEPDGPLYE